MACGTREVVVLALILSSVSTLALAQDVILLEPITVRGDKINRAAEDAPTSITVIDGADAESGATTDLDDVLSGQANVLADEGYQPPAIRGIDGMGGEGTALAAGSQPRIPILVDGVPLPSGDSSYVSTTTVWDLDTIEIARGPQATSTGRNALGGAIRVFTNDPVFYSEGAVRLRYRYHTASEPGGDFMVNTPLIEDQLAFRLTGELTRGESYIDNNPNPLPSGIDPNEQDVTRLRAKLLYEPEAVPELSVLFRAEGSRIEAPTEGLYFGDIDDLTINDPVFGFARYGAYENVDHDVISLQTTYEINDRVTAIARLSGTDNDLTFRDSGEPSSLGELAFQKELTEAEVYVQFQDIGIVSAGVLGAINSDETEKGGINGALLSFTTDGETENTGIYGEVELDAGGLLPNVTVILGGRYERNKLNRSAVDGLGVSIGAATSDEDVFLPKVGFRYDISDETAVGYTYSEGFRSGGLDLDLLAPFFAADYSAVAFGSEKIRQHEIYGKTSVADNALDLKAAAFFYEWDDAQVPGAARYPESGNPALGNVPEAQGYGAEFSAVYHATEELDFYGNLGLLRTEITQINPGQNSLLLGSDLPRAPEITASAGVIYTADNGFFASAEARYVSERQTRFLSRVLGSYTLVDLSIGYETELNGKALKLDAHVNNLFDKRYATFDNGAITGAGEPRAIGVSATMKF